MKNSKIKVWFTCPVADVDVLRTAIGNAGLGMIGNYSHCCFITPGKGYSRPNANADPYLGTVDETEEIDEASIEFVCFEEQLSIVSEVLEKYHPYDEIAVDVWKLMNI